MPGPAKPLNPVSLTPLGALRLGARGVVRQVGVETNAQGVDSGELERRLLEMGFVEGARFHVLHEGLICRDPIAVKLEDMTVALRRREAKAVLVSLNDDAPLAEAAE